jgi:NAD(P)-dependent dehydrogenase (short-subunit alcohol dehydrogenase family)
MIKPVCVIVGVGPGNGAAFAARFSKEGYKLALLARSHEFINELASEIENSFAYECDVTDSNSIQLVFDRIKQEFGRIDVVIYNAGSGVWGNIEEIKPSDFEKCWQVNTFGLMQVSQQIIPIMKKNGRGNIVVIGATASRRGGIKTAAFSSAKAAQRNLAESMAKYLGQFGIHVSLVIIDGVVDLPMTRERMPDKRDDFFVKPADVAENVFWLTQQPFSAWSFEIDLRPFGEIW